MTLRDIVEEVKKSTKCFCDLDNWEPEIRTGHSWVCPIHKIAVERFRNLPKQSFPASSAGEVKP
jgi:hypothetical protein